MEFPHAEERAVRALRSSLDKMYACIARACARAGRSPDEVTLVAVTKTHPLPTIAAALSAGVRDFGENKVQELCSKAEATPRAACRWHMIGHLQRNKARHVVQHAHLFHALDSLRLADALERHAAQAGRVVPCLVQVNVSGEASKFGLQPEAVPTAVAELRTRTHLAIQGLMTLAAPVADPEQVRPQFVALRRLLQPSMHILSMGMSGDYEVAIEEGATHIRVGSAIFGPRLQ